MNTLHDELLTDPVYRRAYAIESAMADAAETVARAMADKNMKKADLARELGRSRAWVTQLLNGSQNATIRTLAEVLYELNAKLVIEAIPFASVQVDKPMPTTSLSE